MCRRMQHHMFPRKFHRDFVLCSHKRCNVANPQNASILKLLPKCNKHEKYVIKNVNCMRTWYFMYFIFRIIWFHMCFTFISHLELVCQIHSTLVSVVGESQHYNTIVWNYVVQRCDTCCFVVQNPFTPWDLRWPGYSTLVLYSKLFKAGSGKDPWSVFHQG